MHSWYLPPTCVLSREDILFRECHLREGSLYMVLEDASGFKISIMCTCIDVAFGLSHV